MPKGWLTALNAYITIQEGPWVNILSFQLKKQEKNSKLNTERFCTVIDKLTLKFIEKSKQFEKRESSWWNHITQF